MSRFGILLLSVVALFLTPLVRATELPAPETADLFKHLQEHRAKFPSLTADFTEEKTTRLLSKPLVSHGSIAFQIPSFFRRELKGNNPSLTVSNGKQLWIYYPNFKEAELYTLGQRAFFDDSIAALTAGLNFQNVDEYYRYQAFKEDDGFRLVLTPKTSGLKRMLRQLTVWVSTDYNIEKSEATLLKDDRVVTTYKNQKAASLPESTFEFTPPSDAHVSQPLGK